MASANRRYSILLLPLILLSQLLFLNHSDAAIKAGSVCKKADLTTLDSGRKYTCIKSGKRLVWNKGVFVVNPTPTPTLKAGDACNSLVDTPISGAQPLRCHSVIGNKNVWIDYTQNALDLSKQKFNLDFTACRISDARSKKIQRQSIAYPLAPDDPSFTSTSTITIAVVPIDFPDVPGSSDASQIYSQVIEETAQWNKWYTRGKSKINWVVYPKWIRATTDSRGFNWIHPKSMTEQVKDNSQAVGQSLIDLAETKLDLKGVQELLFIYPPDAAIQDSINFSTVMTTKYGQQSLGIYATSLWSYRYQKSLAMWLIHENMHRFGFAGHSPAWPRSFSIAHDQSGQSKVMNVWDRMVLDWLNLGDVYCTDRNSLYGQSIVLVPQEREQEGPQGVVIKLSSHELLILESHKQEVWSKEYQPGFYGITLMYVDTTRDTDRSGENFGDDERGINFSRTATYVDMYSLGHRTIGDRNNNNDVKNYLLYQGEFFDFKGVRVEFMQAGFNDTVKVSKVGP